MAKEAPMTEAEATALKAEIAKTVDSTIKPDMTRSDAVKAVCDAVETMEAPKDLGGLGMDTQGMGDLESMAEDRGGAESENENA